MKNSINFCLVLCVTVIGVTSSKFPEDLKRCNFKDSSFNKCVQEAQKMAVQKFAHGYKPLGIPSLDPLSVDNIEIGEASQSPVNVKQSYKNVKIAGLTEYKAVGSSSDMAKNIIMFETLNPIIEMISNYEMTGRVLLLPISGAGFSNITLVQIKTVHTLTGEIVEKKGEKYWTVKNYDVKFFPERVILKFDGLFGGDENLGRTMNEFLNENWSAIFGELKGSFEESYGLIFKQIANQIFSKIPMKEVFLE